jgi:hypothetical protein
VDDTELINAALVLLGETPLAHGAAPKTKVERAAATLARAVRHELLAKQRWTASLATAVVSPDDTLDVPLGYVRAGALPEDLVTLWHAGSDRYTLFSGRKIAWTDGDTVKIEYARDVAYEQCDALLQHALATRLAYRLAHTIDTSDSRAERYRSQANDAELAAASKDALNRQEEPLLRSNWLFPGGHTPRHRFEPQ